MKCDKIQRKIYCAGPLFNPPERNEMSNIAAVLENATYSTFLPHRDGLEFAVVRHEFEKAGIPPEKASSILSRSIFALDVFQVIDADGLVLNMNGRVPDEGAMVEAGIAWAHNKKIAIFKNDARTIIGGTDNPLVVGLANFHLVGDHQAIPEEFDRLFAEEQSEQQGALPTVPSLQRFVDCGRDISSHISNKSDPSDLCDFLLTLFEEASNEPECASQEL